MLYHYRYERSLLLQIDEEIMAKDYALSQYNFGDSTSVLPVGRTTMSDSVGGTSRRVSKTG